mgnify:CR=1 FL=1
MQSSRHSLWFIAKRAHTVFLKQKKVDRWEAERLVGQAFPRVPYSENKFVNVKGDRSPFDGDIIYWSQRESKHYDNLTAKILKKQNHTCGCCGMKFMPGEDIHLHHIDGNHANWKILNLVTLHRSCHQYTHMGIH